MNNEFKIRKMLGNNYHLGVSVENENISWKLFRKYSDWELYMSNDNSAIMTSENNTEEELYKFAKEHYVWNELKTIDSVITVLLTINLIVVIINILIFKIELISYFTCYTAILLFIISISIYVVANHNCGVKDKIIFEDFIRGRK